MKCFQMLQNEIGSQCITISVMGVWKKKRLKEGEVLEGMSFCLGSNISKTKAEREAEGREWHARSKRE